MRRFIEENFPEGLIALVVVILTFVGVYMWWA